MIGRDVNARDEEGWTLTFAAADGRVDLMELLLAEVNVDVNYTNQFGETALIRAVSGGHLGLAKVLLDRGADMNWADEDGDTPLHIAVIRGNVEMTSMLLEKKADVKLRNKKGLTALETARRDRQTKIVDVLESYRSNGGSGKVWRTVQGVGGWVLNLFGKAVVGNGGEHEGEAALKGGEEETETVTGTSSKRGSGMEEVKECDDKVDGVVTGKLLSRDTEAEQSVTTLLPELLDLCTGMEDTQDICEDMLERLQRVQMLLDDTETETEVPTRVRVSFQLITTNFHAFLVQHTKQTSLERLASTRTILRLLHDFHCDIDEVIAQVALSPTDDVSRLINWKEHWDEAVLAVEKDLENSWEQNSSELSGELPDTASQTSALLLFNSETIRHRQQYSVRSQQLLESASMKIARMPGAAVPEIPQWFVPRHEVQWQPRPFASGSYAKVYRGIWRGSKVVIKCMAVRSPSEKKAFLREANIWHKAGHPHIVKFFGACYDCHPCFFICEEASNGTLVDYLHERKKEGRSLIWSKLHEAALGLEYLHQNDIVHGDLKCNQILVTGEGVAKLTDFGFSFVLYESKPQGSGGATRWRASECLAYKEQIPTFESDIYSFGMCVVEALTYDVPWGLYLPDAAVVDLLRHRQFIPRPKAFTVDAEWEFVLALCAFEPSKRIKLVDAIRQLERFAGDVTVACGFSLSNRVLQPPPVSKVALSEDGPRFEFDIDAMGSDGLPYSTVRVDRPTSDRTQNVQNSILHASMNPLDATDISTAAAPSTRLLSRRNGNQSPSDDESAASSIMEEYVEEEKAVTAGWGAPRVVLSKHRNDVNGSNAALQSLTLNTVNDDRVEMAGGSLPKEAVSVPDLSPRVALLRSRHTVRSDNLQASKAEFAPAGDIPMLIGLLRDGNSQQKGNAVVSLWDLAFQRPEYQHKIVAEIGAVDLLVTHTSGGTSTERELAAGVLGFVAPHLPSDVKSNVAAHGGVEALLSSIRRSEDAEWIHQTLIALQGFCADDSDTIRVIVEKFDGSATLTTILQSDDERNRILAEQLLEWLKSNFTELSEMCQRMNEAAPLCLHLLERLRTLLDSGAHSSGSVRNRLRALLVYGEKKMVLRLVSARSLADTLADLHLELDSIGQQASTGDWQPRWKADRDAMMQKLFDVDIWSLVKTLEGSKAQEEALTLLVHEIKEKKDDYTKQQRGFLKKVLMLLAGFSSIGIPVDEKWFIPRTDVEVEDESFNGGSFGKVYYGKYLNADVVVKTVDIKSENDRTDFLREVKVWHEASIHPDIAQLYGACHVGEPCFMVCKYISGGSLREYLCKQQKLGRDCAWRVLLGVTRGLQLLHSRGIVHADLKGGNILVEGDTAMITDFGMSFFAAETQPEFGNLGAIRWRAPEFVATKKASFEADVYSLGMCIVEAVTGKPPWRIEDDCAVKVHVEQKKLPKQPKSMTDDEWALVRAMCDFDPSKRMQLAEVESQIYEFSELEAEEEDARRRDARAAS